MAPPLRSTAMARPAQRPSTSYSLELLSEYANTLDAMPLDLSRIFADLRELDAVLTSTVASVTSKIYQLIAMIEDRSGTVSNEQRLWLLGEIAEEASKVRPGADDKIRIATQAADGLHIQMAHLTALSTHLPEFEPAMLVPKTRYPHVSHRAYMPPHAYETGRRRRAPAGAAAWMGGGTENTSPQKKRRVVQDEDLDYGAATTTKSPRKEKTGESAQARPRGGPRTKKVERHPSPPESVHSITSHPPPHASNNVTTNHRSTGPSTHRNAHTTTNNNTKRRGGAHPQNGASHAADGGNSLLDSVLSRKDAQHLAPSSSTSHPSLADAFDSGKRDKEYWPPENTRDLLAPTSSKARGASTQSSLTTTLASNTLEGGSPAPADADPASVAATGDVGADVDGEADDGKIYCFCDNASFGEMIGCDQPGCKREWFHLSCVGLKEAPKGLWYCDECAAQRKAPRNPRKKKASGGRPNGKNGS